MDMDKIPVKRIIALAVTSVFVFASVYGLMTKTVVYNEVTPLISLVIGYYFGKGDADKGMVK